MKSQSLMNKGLEVLTTTNRKKPPKKCIKTQLNNYIYIVFARSKHIINN